PVTAASAPFRFIPGFASLHGSGLKTGILSKIVCSGHAGRKVPEDNYLCNGPDRRRVASYPYRVGPESIRDVFCFKWRQASKKTDAACSNEPRGPARGSRKTGHVDVREGIRDATGP